MGIPGGETSLPLVLSGLVSPLETMRLCPHATSFKNPTGPSLQREHVQEEDRA